MRTLNLQQLALVFAVILFGMRGLGLAQDKLATPTAEARSEKRTRAAASANEARERARLLYEVIRGALQLMHRDFFDPDDRDKIPSAILEEMFEAVEDGHGVKLRWLGVNAKIMDIDHKPQDDFEKKAAAALDKGKLEFESIEKNTFRYAGAIRLHNRCLKCHVPFRTSLEDRTAGLVINIPILPGARNTQAKKPD